LHWHAYIKGAKLYISERDFALCVSVQAEPSELQEEEGPEEGRRRG